MHECKRTRLQLDKFPVVGSARSVASAEALACGITDRCLRGRDSLLDEVSEDKWPA